MKNDFNKKAFKMLVSLLEEQVLQLDLKIHMLKGPHLLSLYRS